MAKISAANPGGSEPRNTGSLPIPKSKRGIKGYYAEVVRELKKVNWPTRKETNRLNMVVLVVCGMMMLAVTLMSKAAEIGVNLLTKGTP